MNLIDKFVAAVNAGLESWYEAGKVLVEIKQTTPDGFKRIMDKAPYITPDMLHSFVAIGKRELYPPALMVANGRIGHRILELPYKDQERVCNEAVEVVTLTAKGKNITQKKLSEMTPDDADACFSPSGVRSVAEQVRILTEKRNGKKRIHNEGNAEWKALAKPKTLATFTPSGPATNGQPTPKPVGLYAVRLGIGGVIGFEKTTARPMTTQRILLSDGVAVIEICHWKNTP